jgi:Cys-rich repeat protein
MKKDLVLVYVLVIAALVLSLGLVYNSSYGESVKKIIAQEKEVVLSPSGDPIDAGYECLQSEINKSSSLSLEEAVFGMLALGSEREVLNDTIAGQKHATQDCWPRAGCTLKDTAQVLLAYDRAGVDTTGIENWLESKKVTAKLSLSWFLEIDIENHVPSECSIFYDGNEYRFDIEEDMTLSANAGDCLTGAGEYWFSIADNCVEKQFDVSCGDGFITALLYRKSTGGTLFVSSNTHSSGAGGFTEEKVGAECFSTNAAGTCDYEGSLWATLALQRPGFDISNLIAYLVALSDDNKKYFPSSLLYVMVDGGEQLTEIVNSKVRGNQWKTLGTPYNEFYDTSLGLLALGDGFANEVDPVKGWLLRVQKDSGCWGTQSNNDIRDTAFLLYSGWPRYVPLAPVGCASDSDCSITGLDICELGSGLCVECLNSIDCDSGEICNANNVCVADGSGCKEDWSCPKWSEVACISGQQTRSCVDANSCGTEANKPDESQSCIACSDSGNCADSSAAVCTPGGSCVECLLDSDCPSGGRCDMDTNICFATSSCVENWSCASWGSCSNGKQTRSCVDANSCGTEAKKPAESRTCIDCAGDSECGINEVCDLSNNVCVGCINNLDCGGTEVCDLSNNVCVGCLVNGDCGSGQVCDVGTNICSSQCSVDDDCDTGFVCQNSTGLCVDCLGDLDCPSSEVCSVNTNLCVECTVDLDCSLDEICNANNVCEDVGGGGGTGQGARFCEDSGQFCEGATACGDAGGIIDFSLKCLNFGDFCCSVRVQEETCSNLNGNICSASDQCSGSVVSSASGSCCLGTCSARGATNTCIAFGGDCRASCFVDEVENSDSCTNVGDVCCVSTGGGVGTGGRDDEGGIPAWVWIVIFLILIGLVVLAIVYRDKLRIWWHKMRGKVKTKPVTRGGPGPPLFGRGGPPRFGPPHLRRPPVRGSPVGRPSARPRTAAPPRRRASEKESDFEKTMKKLKEIGGGE